MAPTALGLICCACLASALDVRPHQHAKPQRHVRHHQHGKGRGHAPGPQELTGRRARRLARHRAAAAPPAMDPECTFLDESTARSLLGTPGVSAGQAAALAADSPPGCPPANLLMPVRYRNDLGEELARKNLTGVGVEVGTQKGSFTRSLLAGWKVPRLFVQVDLWAHQQNYKDIANVNDTQHEGFRKHACMNAKFSEEHKFARQVVQCKNFSTTCATYFPDESLDFVYLDARHDRKGVLEDLRAYWPKVRPGGVIAGHDYVVQDEPGNWYDPQRMGQDWTTNYDGTKDETGRAVKGAVDDFFSGTEETPADLRRCPRQIVVSYREDQWNTWMVGK